MSNPATASGTITLTFYAGHNILFANQKSNFSIIGVDGWGILDGNLANQTPYVRASQDATGSGFRFEACPGFWVDKISAEDNQFHGGFFTSDQTTPAADGALRIHIGAFRAINNNVRGLHARSSGTSTVWPGMVDIEIGSLELVRNGRVHTTMGDTYTLDNGGVFVHVAGTRQMNIGSILASDEYGITLQTWGDDNSTDPNVTSQYCHINSLIARNCGRGWEYGNGLEGFRLDSGIVDGDTLYSAGQAATDITTIGENYRPALNFDDGTVFYYVTMVMTLPNSWTTAQLTAINVGDLLQSSNSGTGIQFDGAVVLSVDIPNRKATVYDLLDPVAQNSDQVAGLVTSVTPSGAGSLTLNGSQTSAGTSNYAIARKIQIVSAGNASASSFTVTGTDYTGATYSEVIAGPNAGTKYSKRLFKTVVSITNSAATAAAITVGTCQARPFTTTATNQPVRWRAGRQDPIRGANNISTTICGDIKHISVGSFMGKNQGGYSIIHQATPVRGVGVKTFLDISYEKLEFSNCLYPPVINSTQDMSIGNLVTDSVGRGIGSDTNPMFDWKNSESCEVKSMTMRHVSPDFNFTGPCWLVESDCSNINLGVGGQVNLKTTGSVYATINAAGCTISNPKRSDTYAAITKGGGQITGSVAVSVPRPYPPQPITKTANYTAALDDEIIFMDTTSGALTLTLPAAGALEIGKPYRYKNLGINMLTVAATVNGVSNPVYATQYGGADVVWTGATYIVST